jgi:hypothetical protein
LIATNKIISAASPPTAYQISVEVIPAGSPVLDEVPLCVNPFAWFAAFAVFRIICVVDEFGVVLATVGGFEVGSGGGAITGVGTWHTPFGPIV